MGRRQWRARLGLPLASMVALAGGLVVVLGGTPAGATTTTVTNTADDSTSSALRQVVTSASSGDTIVLTAGATYTLNDCALGELRITSGKSLTFQSTSATQNAIINQTCFDRVIVVEPSGTNETTTLRNITLTGGKKADGSGGAIKTNNSGGSLVLDGVEITGNAVAGSHEGGGIDAHGGLTVTNSTIANNCSEAGGGALTTHTGSAPISLTNSTVTGNTQPFNGAIDNATDRSLSLTYVTLVGNTTDGGAGPCFVHPTSTTTQSPLDPSDTESLTAAAGGVGALSNTAVNLFIDGSGTFTSFGTVIGLPTGSPNCLIENATLVSKGYNFEQGGTDATSCQLTGGPGDVQNGSDPMLGALGANGGPTDTRVPQTGSPLINVIPLSACGGPGGTITTDQRGITRPQQTGCEIGAVEIPAPAVVVIQPRFTG
jgi:hypothetical protein